MLPVTLLLALFVPTAEAQDDPEIPRINAQTFRPTLDGRDMLWVDDAARGPDKRFGVRGLFHYTHRPLVYRYEDGESLDLIRGVAQADILPTFSIWRFRAGLHLPIYMWQAGDLTSGGAGLGDIAIDGKFTVLDGDKAPLRIAAGARLFLPTGTVDSPLAARNTGYELAVILDRPIGPLNFAVNLAHRGGPDTSLENVRVNDFFVFRTGVAFTPIEEFGLSGEFAGSVTYAAPVNNPAGHPVEWLAGAWARPVTDFVLRAGVGGALTSGIGAPAYRVIFGLGYEPRTPIEPDTDKDGIIDKLDACPLEPGLPEFDGCPDRDGDGIPDKDDACPDEPGVPEFDGCPDPRQQATIRLVHGETGDPLDIGKLKLSGPQDARWAGTVQLSLDLFPGDYIAEGSGAGFETTTVTFSIDEAPKEVLIEMTPKKSRIKVSRDKVELNETINFDTGKASIQPSSFALLDEVVQFLNDYPEVKKLMIEGHTDDVGRAAYNLDLSKRRAAAVKQYFMDKGIDESRLDSEGFGMERPVDPAKTSAARAKNRRVDLLIEEWEEIEYEVDPD